MKLELSHIDVRRNTKKNVAFIKLIYTLQYPTHSGCPLVLVQRLKCLQKIFSLKFLGNHLNHILPLLKNTSRKYFFLKTYSPQVKKCSKMWVGEQWLAPPYLTRLMNSSQVIGAESDSYFL